MVGRQGAGGQQDAGQSQGGHSAIRHGNMPRREQETQAVRRWETREHMISGIRLNPNLMFKQLVDYGQHSAAV